MFESLMQAVHAVDRSFRHVFMGLVVTLVVIGTLIAYDKSLREERLSALSQAGALMRDSKSMLHDSGDPAIQLAGSILREQALIVLQRTGTPECFSPYRKFLMSIAPWFLVGLLSYYSSRPEGFLTWGLNSFPLFLSALAFGLIGAFLPDSNLPFFHTLVYPLGHVFLFLILVFAVGLNKLAEPPV